MSYNVLLNFQHWNDAHASTINPIAFVEHSALGDMSDLNAEDFLEGEKEAELDQWFWTAQYERYA